MFHQGKVFEEASGRRAEHATLVALQKRSDQRRRFSACRIRESTEEPVSWATLSASNAAYTDVLGILNNCPEHDEGKLFVFLTDFQPYPYYGLRRTGGPESPLPRSARRLQQQIQDGEGR